MKIDMHVHPLWDTKSDPAWDEIAFGLRVGRSNGLDVACVTEHRHSERFEELVRSIFEQGRLGGRQLAPGVVELEDGLTLTSGAEVALKGGGDVGVHAEPEVVLGLDGSKGAYSLDELHGVLKGTGRPFLVIAHHIFKPGKWISGLPGPIDAVELPAKHIDSMQLYRDFATEHDLPMVGGADSHTWVQLGACYTETAIAPDDSPPLTIEWLASLVRSRQVTPHFLADAGRLVSMSRLYREHLCASH